MRHIAAALAALSALGTPVDLPKGKPDYQTWPGIAKKQTHPRDRGPVEQKPGARAKAEAKRIKKSRKLAKNSAAQKMGSTQQTLELNEVMAITGRMLSSTRNSPRVQNIPIRVEGLFGEVEQTRKAVCETAVASLPQIERELMLRKSLGELQVGEADAYVPALDAVIRGPKNQILEIKQLLQSLGYELRILD